MKFSKMSLKPEILKAIRRSGFEEATLIQEKTIPLVLEERDVVGQAQAGTGKTAAFGLPILQNLDKRHDSIQAIVIEPAREFAIQTQEELFRLDQDGKAHVRVVYGGADIRRQIHTLEQTPTVLTGTPGRLLDHLKHGTIDIPKVKTVALDEADEMLDMEFIQDIESILDYASDKHQTLSFSTTMSRPVLRTGERFVHDPKVVRIEGKELTANLIDQYFVRAKENEKFDILCRSADVQNPDLAVIFSRTKRRVDELMRGLQARGCNATRIHDDPSQTRRMSVLKRFCKGKLDILIVTDMTARGLDISGVGHVYNYDIPQDPDSYIHRIGGTGCAGQNGMSVTFITPNEVGYMRTIEQLTHKKMIPLEPPTDEEAFKGQLSAANKKVTELLDSDLSKCTTKTSQLLDDYSAMDLVAALLKNLFKDAESVKVEITPEKPLPFKSKHGNSNHHFRRNFRRGGDRNGRYHRKPNARRDGRRHDSVIRKKG